jgi:hypothetical protein
MAAENLSQVSVKHPAPHRHRVSLAALFFGLAAAPAAWNAQLLISVALSAHACYPRDVPLTLPIWGGLWPILVAIDVAGIVLAVAGGLVSLRSWRLTFDEAPGSAHQLLDIGQGRTRFLAMFGVLTSVLFTLGMLFAAAAVFVVPLCR